jgi:hypothetical protein
MTPMHTLLQACLQQSGHEHNRSCSHPQTTQKQYACMPGASKASTQKGLPDTHIDWQLLQAHSQQGWGVQTPCMGGTWHVPACTAAMPASPHSMGACA